MSEGSGTLSRGEHPAGQDDTLLGLAEPGGVGDLVSAGRSGLRADPHPAAPPRIKAGQRHPWGLWATGLSQVTITKAVTPLMAAGFAEIGHLPLAPGDMVCTGGRRGRVETVASTRATIDRVRSAVGKAALTIDDVFDLAHRGDPDAVAA
ncbi:ROK family protein [Micromonospora chokoriensis]|uniref:ROK family protein n=1 Tax=Micromonospora chokoriensis TaxID=356851 RepID=A0A1C4UR57_9ACTN|nr:ROK family protein [Micromonospora chokoriensis]SCE74114.1 ROK family protein [Micromonospora chokoriensis]